MSIWIVRNPQDKAVFHMCVLIELFCRPFRRALRVSLFYDSFVYALYHKCLSTGGEKEQINQSQKLPQSIKRHFFQPQLPGTILTIRSRHNPLANHHRLQHNLPSIGTVGGYEEIWRLSGIHEVLMELDYKYFRSRRQPNAYGLFGQK
jgi:hypothetical protein